MKNKKNIFWKTALTHGAILGVVYVLYSILLYLLDLNFEKWASWANYLIMIIAIIWATKSYRDNIEKGHISYSKALGYGVVVVFSSTIISALYIYIFMKYIDTDLIEKMFVMMENELMKKGLQDEEIEMAVEINKKFMSPASLALISIPTMTFVGFIISLITSIFLKKENNSFESQMNEIK